MSHGHISIPPGIPGSVADMADVVDVSVAARALKVWGEWSVPSPNTDIPTVLAS